MDRILRATAADGFIKMSAVSAKDTVQRAKDIHKCTPTTAAALGRTLCAASMMGNLLKEDNGSLTIRINGGGPIGSIIAVSDSMGYVRGYVTNPTVDLPLRSDGKLDVGGAVGKDGMLTVSRDIGLAQPYVGSTELVSGEIAEDLTAYLLESEQVPSACGLGVLIDTDLSVKAAGGFIVQLMPGAPDEYIDVLEENIFMMDQLTTILTEDGLEAVFEQVLKGLPYHVVDEDEVGYRCYCSRERVGDAILGVGEGELESMINEGKDIDVSCQFCDTVYTFTPDDLRTLLDESKKA
ncbi:MAG: Hsp33 family molecular chaperone HslO [Oscillospiraceae bacterium]